MAALAFSILVYIAFGAKTDVALPRSGNTTVVIAYSVHGAHRGGGGALMAMVYRPDRPYRANYLLLSGGIVMIAASDRMVAYLHTIGAEGGDLWGGIGFVLGPLMIAFALLELPPRPASAAQRGRHGLGAADPALCRIPRDRRRCSPSTC